MLEHIFSSHALLIQCLNLNYQSWSGAMIVSLTAKNKIGFLNGTIAIPDASSIEYISWMKWNMTIFSLIINSISREIASSLMYTNSVREVWLNLQDRFSQGNALKDFCASSGIIIFNRRPALNWVLQVQGSFRTVNQFSSCSRF